MTTHLSAAALEVLRAEADAITARLAEQVPPHLRMPDDADRARIKLDGYQTAIADADQLLNDLTGKEDDHV